MHSTKQFSEGNLFSVCWIYLKSSELFSIPKQAWGMQLASGILVTFVSWFPDDEPLCNPLNSLGFLPTRTLHEMFTFWSTRALSYKLLAVKITIAMLDSFNCCICHFVCNDDRVSNLKSFGWVSIKTPIHKSTFGWRKTNIQAIQPSLDKIGNVKIVIKA